MKLLVTALAGAWLAAGPLGAVPAPVWSVARCAHFEVFASNGPKQAADALTMFEDVRGFFRASLPLGDLRETAARPVRVVVFSGDKEFAPYRVNQSGSAFFQSGADRDYIVMREFGGDAFHVVAHEYAHAALGRRGADLPPWLAEGLAEFYSSAAIRQGRATVGAAPPGRLDALRRGTLMAVPALLAVTRSSPEYNAKDHAGMFYAEAWALTHMLMIDPRYQPATARMLDAAAHGVATPLAFGDAYGKTPQQIETDLRAYVARGFYGSFSVDVPDERDAPGAPATVDDFAARIMLADVLAQQTGKDLSTRSLLDQLESERPADLSVTELRAYFERKTRGAAAAEPYFARAVDGGSTNAALIADYALHISARDPERAAALLARAMTLAPDTPDFRVHAAAQQLRLEHPDAAMALIAPLTRVPAHLQFEYYQIVAHGRAAAGDFDEAAAAAARVMQAADTPEELAFARTLLADVGGPPDMKQLITGTVVDIDCAGDTPVLALRAGERTWRLAVDDREKIMIAGGGTLDLTCGAQQTPARVGFSDDAPPAGLDGRVRFLDFRKKDRRQASPFEAAIRLHNR
jgi:hypothetical protein